MKVFPVSQPEHSSHTGDKFHPVIAIGHPDHDGWTPVVSVSHNHPMEGPHTDAHNFDKHTGAAGHGYFLDGSQVATSYPTHVHVSNLQQVNPNSNLPHQLHPKDTKALVNHVRTCSNSFSPLHTI